jgi:hypothetical protein
MVGNKSEEISADFVLKYVFPNIIYIMFEEPNKLLLLLM